MVELNELRCESCQSAVSLITETEVAELLTQIPEWHITHLDNIMVLERCYVFNNYKEALAFTKKVGDLAEAQQHHPRIVNDLGKVTIYWWTHKLGGLHRNDFIMAAKTNAIVSG